MTLKWQILPMPDTTGQKWELKHGDVVLGTIFRKLTNKQYSLWISSPLVVEKSLSIATRSYQCSTLEESVAKFRELYDEKVIPWARAVCEAAHMTWEPPDGASDDLSEVGR
jgi:hypothetical protein